MKKAESVEVGEELLANHAEVMRLFQEPRLPDPWMASESYRLARYRWLTNLDGVTRLFLHALVRVDFLDSGQALATVKVAEAPSAPTETAVPMREGRLLWVRQRLLNVVETRRVRVAVERYNIWNVVVPDIEVSGLELYGAGPWNILVEGYRSSCHRLVDSLDVAARRQEGELFEFLIDMASCEQGVIE